jgi:hypothetical protein
MSTHGFAIIPDGSSRPTAVFAELEDAIDWGLRTYGADRFSIRWLSLLLDPLRPARATSAGD